jgi:hypothetical protein
MGWADLNYMNNENENENAPPLNTGPAAEADASQDRNKIKKKLDNGVQATSTPIVVPPPLARVTRSSSARYLSSCLYLSVPISHSYPL